MSHRLCSKHSLSPIRPSGNNVPVQQQSQQPNLSTSQLKFTSPVKKRILTTPMSQNISTGLSPMTYGLPDLQAQFQMQQQHQAHLQMQNLQSPFQNYVSQEGFAVRAQEVDQNQLRLEIAAREQELKLLAQMDYLIDLIKNIDQDRNVNIDAAKIQEIQQLKMQYQTNIEDELINQSFSQNLGKAEIPKEGAPKGSKGSISANQGSQQLTSSKEGGLLPQQNNLAASQGALFQPTFSVQQQDRLVASQGAQAQGTFVRPSAGDAQPQLKTSQQLRSSQNQGSVELSSEIERLRNQLKQTNQDFEQYKTQYNDEIYRQISLGFKKELDEEKVKELMAGSLSNNLAIASAEKGEEMEKLEEEISQLKAYAGAHEQEAASQEQRIQKLLEDISELERIKNDRNNVEEEITQKTTFQEAKIQALQSQLEATLLEVQKAIQNAEESRQKVSELEEEKHQVNEAFEASTKIGEQLKEENQSLQKDLEAAILSVQEQSKAIEDLKVKQSEEQEQTIEIQKQLNAANEQLKNENQSQQTALEEVKEKLNGAEAEISALQKALKDHTSSSGVPQEELQKLQVQIEEYRVSQNDAEQRAQNSESQLKEQAEQIEHLNIESQDLKQQFIALEVKNDDLQAKNNDLLNQLAAINGIRNSELQLKQDAVAHINELQSMLEEKEQENQRLLQENERVVQDRDALNIQLEELQKALADMEQALTAQAQAIQPADAHLNDAIKEHIANLQQSLNDSTAMRISANNNLLQSQRQMQQQQLVESVRSQHSQSKHLESSQIQQQQEEELTKLQQSQGQLTGSQHQQQQPQEQQSLSESQKQEKQQPKNDILNSQQSAASSLQRSQQQRSQALLQKSQQLQQQLLASNHQMVLSQHELAHSIHATKMTQSIHGNESLKESQHSHCSSKSLKQQPQQEQVQEDAGAAGEGAVDGGCEECESCMLEAALIQNEQLKQQLLIKEKEIIELKTNPAYYARATNYGMPGIPIATRSPFNQGLGANLIEANDQAVYSRLFESPMLQQQQQQQQTNFVTSAFAASPKIQQQQQQSSATQQLSGSKALRNSGSGVSFSGQKSQAQQPQSYSVIQNEIEQLQKIFDSKCKEVESWKKTYTQFSKE